MEIMSDAEKMAYQSVIDDIHDTWKRPIYVFQTSEQMILSENPNYNFAYKDAQPNNDVSQYVVNSGMFYARVFYLKSNVDNTALLSSSSVGELQGLRTDIRLNNPFNIVQIKIDETGYQFLKDSKVVEIDGDKYGVFSAPRKHGLFTPKYYTYWLKREV